MTTLRRADADGVPYGDNLYLEVETGYFIWRERIKGVNHWRSTGTDKIGLARQQVKVFRSEATGKPLQALRKTFVEAFDLTLKIKAAKSEKTAISAKTQIEHLRPWFAEHCPYLSAFEQNFAETWAQYCVDQAAATPGRKLKHDREILLFALKRAREKGWITREFAKKTKHGKFGLELNESSETIGRHLEDDEVNRLLSACQSNPTLYLQVRMAVLMGMRLREILHLRWDEFDWKTEELVVKGARVKTRRGRRVPIHAALVKELRAKLKESEGPYVFPARHRDEPGAPYDWANPQDDNSNAFTTARERAGSDARFHDLRHTFMTNAMAAGIQPADVSKLTGASLKVVMAIYHHVRGDVREKTRNLFCGKFVGAD